jgi:hypothetical protein
VLANNHYPPPALNNMAERPKIPSRPSHVHCLVQVLLEPGPVDVGQGRTNQLGQISTGRPLRPAHATLLAAQTELPPRSQRSLLGEPAGQLLLPLGTLKR